MFTPITCLTVVCDGCHAVAETDDGDPCHFTTTNDAREWLALDPNATDDDDLTRWLFGPDNTHLCPDCQCAAHGHVTTRRDNPAPDAVADGRDLAAICLRCGRWLDLRPTTAVIDEAHDLVTTRPDATSDARRVA